MHEQPSRSFGSNHVDLGGMMPPASAIAIRSSMPTGNSENATAARPLATSRSSSACPRIPPTKSMRLSVRGSPTPRCGPSTVRCNTSTSSASARDVPAGGAGNTSVCQRPARYIPTSPRRRGRRVARAVRDERPQRRQERLRRLAAQVFDHSVVGQDPDLRVGERGGDERRRAPRARQRLPRARRTRDAMMAVGDVERGQRLERLHQRLHIVARHAPHRVRHAVARREVVQRPASPRRVGRSRRPRASGDTSGTRRPSARGSPSCAACGRLPCPCASSRAS